MVALLIGQIVEQTVRPYTWFPWVIVIWVALVDRGRAVARVRPAARAGARGLRAGRRRGERDVSIALTPADVARDLDSLAAQAAAAGLRPLGLGGLQLGAGVLDRVADAVAEVRRDGDVALIADRREMAGPARRGQGRRSPPRSATSAASRSATRTRTSWPTPRRSSRRPRERDGAGVHRQRRLGHDRRHRQGAQRPARRRPARRGPDRRERQRLRRRPVGAARRRRQAHADHALAGAAADRHRRDRARPGRAQPRRARRPARHLHGARRLAARAAGRPGRQLLAVRGLARPRPRRRACSSRPTAIHRGEPEAIENLSAALVAQRDRDGRRRAHGAVLGHGAHGQPPAGDDRRAGRCTARRSARSPSSPRCCGRACATVARAGGLRALRFPTAAEMEPRVRAAFVGARPVRPRRRGVLARLRGQARALERGARRS